MILIPVEDKYKEIRKRLIKEMPYQLLPVTKKHHNVTYKGNGNEVLDLTAHKTNEHLHMVWKLTSVWERLKFLLTGEVTVTVCGHMLPPMKMVSGDFVQNCIDRKY